MSDQIIPYGGTLEYSTDQSTWNAIPEAKGFPLPATTQEFPEVTSLDSPNGFREYIKGLKDAGEVSFVVGYTPAGFAIIDSLDGQLVWIRATLPQAPSQSSGGDQFEFQAFLTPSIDSGDVGAPLDMTVTCRISGAVTWTQGS